MSGRKEPVLVHALVGPEEGEEDAVEAQGEMMNRRVRNARPDKGALLD